jgi:hypothetical protein
MDRHEAEVDVYAARGVALAVAFESEDDSLATQP